MIKYYFLFLFIGFGQYILIAQTTEKYLSEYLVHLPDHDSPQEAISYLLDNFNDADVELVSKNFRYYLLRFSPDDSRASAFKYSNNQAPKLYPNLPMKPRSTSPTPNDPMLEDQWYLDIIKAYDAWDITTGGKTVDGTPVVLGVFEGGMELEHSDIDSTKFYVNELEIPDNGIDDDANGFIDDYRGFNVTYDGDNHNSDISGDDGHGNGVIGIIGASTDNDDFISGLIWDPNLLAVTGTRYDVAEWIRGLDYIYTQRKLFNNTNGADGAFVVAWNMSWGISDDYTTGDYPEFCNLFDSLGTEGILTIGATTNSNYSVDDTLSNGVLKHPDIPSNCPSDYLIVVGNSDENDQKARGGTGIKSVDLFAPGEDVLILNEDDSEYDSGTSFATPQVTATVGLMYSVPVPGVVSQSLSRPDETALEIKHRLLSEVDIVPDLQGYVSSDGRLNTYRAVNSAQDYFMTVGTTSVVEGDDLFTLSYWNNTITIDIETSQNRDHVISIFDVLGKTIYTGQNSGQTLTINTDQWMSGVYFINVSDGNRFSTKKLVKP